MVNYPLTPVESTVVRWTGRVMTFLAVAMIVLMGTIAIASP
jgi:hypothetical protein